jgi:hypothetical protein
MRFRPAKLAGSALERRVAETIREGDHGGKIVFREPLQTLPDVSLGRSVLQAHHDVRFQTIHDLSDILLIVRTSARIVSSDGLLEPNVSAITSIILGRHFNRLAVRSPMLESVEPGVPQ